MGLEISQSFENLHNAMAKLLGPVMHSCQQENLNWQPCTSCIWRLFPVREGLEVCEYVLQVVNFLRAKHYCLL